MSEIRARYALIQENNTRLALAGNNELDIDSIQQPPSTRDDEQDRKSYKSSHFTSVYNDDNDNYNDDYNDGYDSFLL
jgi:hypothetical protein